MRKRFCIALLMEEDLRHLAIKMFIADMFVFRWLQDNFYRGSLYHIQ